MEAVGGENAVDSIDRQLLREVTDRRVKRGLRIPPECRLEARKRVPVPIDRRNRHDSQHLWERKGERAVPGSKLEPAWAGPRHAVADERDVVLVVHFASSRAAAGR